MDYSSYGFCWACCFSRIDWIKCIWIISCIDWKSFITSDQRYADTCKSISLWQHTPNSIYLLSNMTHEDMTKRAYLFLRSTYSTRQMWTHLDITFDLQDPISVPPTPGVYLRNHLLKEASYHYETTFHDVRSLSTYTPRDGHLYDVVALWNSHLPSRTGSPFSKALIPFFVEGADSISLEEVKLT